MINTDSYYEIGSGHTFCQDYADSGKVTTPDNLYHYAIVCDGCSGSKELNGTNYTDVGARLIARAFPIVIRELVLTNSLTADAIAAQLKEEMLKACFWLRLSIASFDATVVAIVYDQGKDELHTFAWGDGKIFYKYKTDSGFLTDIGYASNAPFYLSHQTSASLELRYESTFGSKFADIVSYIVTPNSALVIPEASKSFQKFHTETYKNASQSIAHASVFTDGIDTYHKVGDTSVLMPKHNVYNQLTQYKAMYGEFVKRRMQMVDKFCKKEGWTHFDDVAVATIAF